MAVQAAEGESRLMRSGIIVSGMTFLSRILGLARDVVLAYFFGASANADAFFLAFKIPNFFRRMFAEGAFSQAFVPVLAEAKRSGKEAVEDLIHYVSGALGCVLFGITVLGVLGSAYLVMLFGFGYVIQEDDAQLQLAGQLLKFTFPYLALISLTAFAGSILNAYGKFAVPAFTPVILNLCLIAGAFLGQEYLDLPIEGLAISVLVAGLLQLGFQLPSLAKLGLVPIPKLNVRHPRVKQVFVLMLPALFGASVSQLNLLIDTMLATLLVKGSISWLYYADRLLELPLALIGIALATVILPSLSADAAEEDMAAFSSKLDWGLRWVAILGVPASVALLVLAEPLITTIFYRGAMTALDVSMAALALQAYAAGLLGHMFVKILAPGFFARQDMKSPVEIGIVALVSNMILNALLIVWLGHIGLALATSASAFVNAFLLWRRLRKNEVYRPLSGWPKLVLQIAVATVVMVLGIEFVVPATDQWLSADVSVKAAWLLSLSLGGAMLYGIVMLLLGVRPAQLRNVDQ